MIDLGSVSEYTYKTVIDGDEPLIKLREENNTYMTLKYDKLDLKQFDLKNENGRYYLDVALLGKTKDQTEEVRLKLEVPIFLNQVHIESESNYFAWEPTLYADLGFGRLRIKDNKYFIKKIKQTMTLSEVEKELGYKINLVSESGRE